MRRRHPASRPRRSRRIDQLAFFYKHGLAYAQEMGNRPQTLYGIADSPVGLAAWMLDHDIRSYALIARVFDGKPEGLTRDDILDNVTLYWLTNTAVSSARLYWENKLAFFAPKDVAIPVAVSVFPDEIDVPPRSWAEKAYPNLIHYNRLPKGGHFAAWEQPEIFRQRTARGVQIAALTRIERKLRMPFVTVGKENGANIDIYYKDWGSGQPIVFSHGWPLSADDWDPQMLFFLEQRLSRHCDRSTRTWSLDSNRRRTRHGSLCRRSEGRDASSQPERCDSRRPFDRWRPGRALSRPSWRQECGEGGDHQRGAAR